MLRFLTTLWLLLVTAPAAAQSHFPTDSVIRAKVQRFIIPTGGRVGVVIGLLEADGSRRVVSVGDAGYDGRTLYEIGSITKVFTGILLADMVERGEAQLEQPVAELLPDSASVPGRAGRQIRLVDLATHSSGLPRMPNNFAPADWRNPYADYTVARLYDFLRSYELPRDIGAGWEYSNIGFGLLGHALAVRADTSYEALVTARILAQLGMRSTMITIPDSVRPRLAPGHNASGMPVSNWDLPTLAGAGALRSTADDLLTFLAANLAPPMQTTLGRAMRRAQQLHYRRSESGGNGLGWGVNITRYGRPVFAHGGGTAGYSTFVALDPERRIGVVVLSNRTGDVPAVGMHLLDPRHPLSTEGLRKPFTWLALTLALLLVIGVFVAWRRTGAGKWHAWRAALLTLLSVSVWLLATALLAGLGLLGFDPPTMALLFAAVLALSVGVGTSGVGRRLATGLPLAVLVGVHAFRLPLELMMHRAYEYGLMPVQMSYSGLNFDIVTGVSALVVAVFLASGRVGLRVVRIWNLLGTLLLVNIIVIAWLSAPTPLRVFKNAPANTWITTPPYVWLPAVMVAVAILGHILVFRRLSLLQRA